MLNMWNKRAVDDDEEAILLLKAMGYQISKEICAMAAVLEGQIDAVVLSGNLCRANTVVTEIQNRVGFLGRLLIFPGKMNWKTWRRPDSGP